MTPLNAKRILAVDDEEVMLKMYREYFGQQGVELRIAPSLSRTMELLSEEPADIVILDLKLGEQSGKDALFSIRKLNPKVQFVFVTAHATDDLLRELIDLGVFEVIKKPCTIRTIYDTVEKLALSSTGLKAPRP